MMSDTAYAFYYFIVFFLAFLYAFFYIILSAVFIYEYFLAPFRKVKTYRRVLVVCIVVLSLKLILSLSMYSFVAVFFDVLCLLLLFYLLRVFYSPFYKALHCMQAKDYVGFFKNLQNANKWWKIRTFKGLSLFHYAVFLNDLNFINIMLSKHIKVSFKEDENEIKLIKYIKEIQSKNLFLNLSDSEKKELLFLRLGKNASFVANSGVKKMRINFKQVNSLCFAAFCSNHEAVRLLLENNANVDDYALFKGMKFYPESFALINSNFIMSDFFLKRFKQVSKRLKSFYDYEFIDKACLYVLYDDLSSLKNAKFNDLYTLFYLAIALCKIQVLKFLLDEKLQNLSSKQRASLLEISLKFDALQSFAVLSKEYHFDTSLAFFNAVCFGSKKIVKYMLDNAYKPNDQEMIYLYYLYFDSKSEELFEILKSIGLEFRDKQGETPLLSAVKYNLSEQAFALIEAGADTTVKDNEGRDLLFYAKQNNNQELIKMLSLDLFQA